MGKTGAIETFVKILKIVNFLKIDGRILEYLVKLMVYGGKYFTYECQETDRKGFLGRCKNFGLRAIDRQGFLR